MKVSSVFDVLIVGAGPAGLGMGVALKKMGLQNFAILERYEIGASFRRWPREMRMITPSFNGNSFGYLDLNAIAPFTSPAYSLKTEHPDGNAYADYLLRVAEYFQLPVLTGFDVESIQVDRSRLFRIQTSQGDWWARFVIWAAGEYQYPRLRVFDGSDLCLPNCLVRTYKEIPGQEIVIIGGYESGIDAAIHLVRSGKTVHVIERSKVWQADGQDPSTALSPYTLDRLREVMVSGRLNLIGGATVENVFRSNGKYCVETADGAIFNSDSAPILATGFHTSATLIKEHFYWRMDGMPELSDVDESTKTAGLFLVGPSVRQAEVIFCFIYKFRQRFAVVAQAIGERLNLDSTALEEYRLCGMFLDDLSCCSASCSC
jgi:thioredoxin reductase